VAKAPLAVSTKYHAFKQLNSIALGANTALMLAAGAFGNQHRPFHHSFASIDFLSAAEGACGEGTSFRSV
jgi:hypothetical protein